MGAYIGTINALFAQMQQVGWSLYGVLLDEGRDLLWLLAFIMTGWYLVNLLLADGFPDFFANCFNLAIKGAIVLFMLTSWTGTVRDVFVNNLEQVAQKVAGGDTDPAAMVTSILSGMQMVWSGTRGDSAQTCTEVKDYAPDGTALGTSHQVCTAGAGANEPSASVWDVLKSLPVILLTFLAKGLAILSLLLMGCVFMVVAQMASFLLAVAFCLGPILIPWYLLPPTEFLLDSWLRFTITAGLYKVVAWVFVTIFVRGAVPSINGLVAQASAAGATAHFETNYLAMLALTFIGIVGAFMLWQVPTIAGALAGGGGGSAKGFGRGFVGRGITKALSAAAKAAK